MAGSYDILIRKIDEFTRKYYKNRLIRGAIYSAALILGFFLLVTLLEYFGRFDKAVRTILFWTFTLSSAAILIRFIFIPAAKIFRLGKLISHEEAARMIGRHFSDVQDKLLNTLQLRELSVQNPAGRELIEASIDQKISSLKPIPFSSAIDLRENRRYLKYVIPPIAVVVVLLFAAPSVLKEGTDRLVRYDEEIRPTPPFSWSVVNDDLEVPEYQDFKLEVALEGKVLPDKLYLVLNGSRFKFNEDGKTSFSYVFRGVRENQEFQLYADGFYSETYTLRALPVPALVQFAVTLDYPAYTGRKDEEVRNTGDFTLPQGTKVRWQFDTRHTQVLEFSVGDSINSLSPQGDNRFSTDYLFMQSASYSLRAKNSELSGNEAIQYQVKVVPDRYPAIAVSEERDSLSDRNLYFTGEVSDDCGFRRLTFNYSLVGAEDQSRLSGEMKSIDLRLNPGSTNERFFHHWDLGQIELMPGDEISYYFEVWDNDGVNGSKSSRSASRVYAAPTLNQLEEKQEQQNEEIKDELEEGIKEARDLQKELEELRRKMLEKENLDWKDKKKLEELLQKQKDLQQKMEQVSEKNEKKNFSEQEFKEPKPELLEKQKKLEELFDQVMSEEMKKLYEEIQKLMEELNKEEIQEKVEEMNMESEDMEKEMDRLLEQFKQLEWEKKMTETIDELEKLAEKQEELSEKSQEENANSEELKEEQEKLNEAFEEIREDIEKLEELNKELENPNRMPETEKQEQGIQEQMEKSSEELSKDKKKKASENQKGASQQMKEMSQQMQMAMDQGSSEQAEEDMDALRDLLENIIRLSFDQEGLMEDFRKIDQKDPKYVQYGQKQRKLKDDSKMVEDSLYALSKRVIQIEPIVLKEIGLINRNMDKSLEEIAERQTPKVTEHQQYVMTSFNNLALLLDEALKQMQQQMANKQPGQGNCEKPGGSGAKPSASEMKKMQEALSKQLEQMKQQMGKDGQPGQQGQKKQKSGMSEEVAKMAAKQAAIRQQLEQLSQEMNEDGSRSGNGLKEIAKEMEEIEKDIVNMRIDEETIRRQQDILIRLLEAENAERQRELDEQRKSNEALDQKFSNPMKYSEYQEQKERETEMLRTMPPALKPYYRDRVNEYFNKLGEE